MKTLKIALIALATAITLAVAVPAMILGQQHRQSAEEMLQNKNMRGQIMTAISSNPNMTTEMMGYMMKNKHTMQMMAGNRAMMQSMMNAAGDDTSATRNMAGMMMQHQALMQVMMQMMAQQPEMMQQMQSMMGHGGTQMHRNGMMH